jgi:energy-coupling factor transporter ATP-binding protein EcfA2
VKLTDEQKFVIKEILQFKRDVVKLGGHAGCGKTVIAKHLHMALPKFAVAAYTGKAADVLRRKGVKTASTIHSLIYVPEVDEHGNIIYDGNGNPRFILAPHLQCDGVIIDEASMVSEEIYQDQIIGLKRFIAMQAKSLSLLNIFEKATERPHSMLKIRSNISLDSKPSLTSIKWIKSFVHSIKRVYRSISG